MKNLVMVLMMVLGLSGFAHAEEQTLVSLPF